MIYIGADHRGFRLKEKIKEYFVARGVRFEDLGNVAYDEGDDYVDFARAVAEHVSAHPADDQGILLCGSGHGVDIVANKHRGVRAAIAYNDAVTKQSREHDDANVLVIPADLLGEEETLAITDLWLATPFSGEERHVRRLEKIRTIEDTHFQ